MIVECPNNVLTDGIGVPLVAYLQCYMITIWKSYFFFNYDVVMHGYKTNIICMFVDTNNAAFKINFQYQI